MSNAWRTSRSQTNQHKCKSVAKHLVSGKLPTGTKCPIVNVSGTKNWKTVNCELMSSLFFFWFQIAICMPPCQNLGFCIAPGVCNCPDNFEGSECQFAKSKPCLDKPPTPMNSRVVCNEKECISTCNRGFAFPGGSKKLTMVCDSGNWIQRQQQPGTFQKVPDCQRNYT